MLEVEELFMVKKVWILHFFFETEICLLSTREREEIIVQKLC